MNSMDDKKNGVSQGVGWGGKMVSARRGWGTQRANPGAPAAQRLCPSTLRGTCTQWATAGAPDAFRGATSARRGSGTQGANRGAPASQRRCSSTPRGSSTQRATAGAPEAPCGKEWWTRQGKELPTKPRWAEPRTAARSQCSVNPPGNHAEQDTWGSRTRKHREAGCGRPEDGAAQTVKRPPQQPAQLQYANYWAPLTHKRHILPHPAQPQHTNHWAPRTRRRHQQEHRPQRPTESSDPTRHAKGRMGDCPGPRKETITRRNVTQGGWLSMGMPMGRCPWLAVTVWTWMLWMTRMGHGRDAGGFTEGDQPPVLLPSRMNRHMSLRFSQFSEGRAACEADSIYHLQPRLQRRLKPVAFSSFHFVSTAQTAQTCIFYGIARKIRNIEIAFNDRRKCDTEPPPPSLPYGRPGATEEGAGRDEGEGDASGSCCVARALREARGHATAGARCRCWRTSSSTTAARTSNWMSPTRRSRAT